MKRHIKFGKGISDIPSKLIQEKLDYVVPDTRPVVLLGPSGCGKSMLLKKIAFDAKKKNIPVALVNFRRIRPRQEVLNRQQNDLLPIAAQVMSQIGYPVREPFISTIKNIIFNKGFTFDVKQQLARERLEESLDFLFVVSLSLKEETGIQPILLFDEIQDLMKNIGLRQKGGADIFASVATNLINNGVNSHAIRSAVAGSNTKLARQLHDFKLGPVRTSKFFKQDVDETTMLNFLKEKKNDAGKQLYQDKDLHNLVKLCGTRFRNLVACGKE
jgi:hypothetical protein